MPHTFFLSALYVFSTNGIVMCILMVCSISMVSVVIPRHLLAQDHTATHSDTMIRHTSYYGMIVGGQMFRHSGTFPVSLTDTCGIFTSAPPMSSYLVGLTYDRPVFSFAEISLRLLYQRTVGRFTAQSCCTEVFDQRTQTYVPFTREISFVPDIRSLVFDAGVSLYPIPSVPVYMRLGADIAMPLFGATYTQREQILSPDFVRFENNTTERITESGELQNIQTSFGGNVGLGVHIAMHRHWDVYPEISYRRGFNFIDPVRAWNLESVRLTLGVRYNDDDTLRAMSISTPTQSKQLRTTSAIVALPAPSLYARIDSALTLRQTMITQTYPLLPYIFFDSAQSALRPVYHIQTSTESFSENDISKETLDIYYALIPIIAQRMKRMPQAQLTIIGTSDSKEASTEQERQILARHRATAVYNAFVGQGILPNRITVTIQATPSIVSSERIKEGVEENRRVELLASQPEILAPVVHSRFLEYIFDEKQRMMTIQSNDSLRDWTISVMHRGALVRAWRGHGIVPTSFSLRTDSLPTQRIGLIATEYDTLRVNIQAQTTNGTLVSTSVAQLFRKVADNVEVHRLSLIVFDFDKSEISSANKNMMQTFVQEAIKPMSSITIAGTTDRVGEAPYNTLLSQARADAVKKQLLLLQPSANILWSKGFGESMLLFSNDVPEGRFYCRTVSVVVKTPIE